MNGLTVDLNVNSLAEEVIVEDLEVKKQRLLNGIITLHQRIEAIKPCYEELDKLTLELKDLVGVESYVIEDRTLIGVQVVDNFAEKNTAFRVASIQRFKAEIETADKRAVRVEKLSKKAKKEAKLE